MSVETVARRYSAALADTVLDKGIADTTKSELSAWSQIFRDSGELRMIFSSPAIKFSDKTKLLDGLIAKTKPSQITANFLKVLLQNGRLGFISEINDRFTTALEERTGIISAEITSSRELQDNERAEFQKELSALTGKKVRVDFRVNKDIIGGVITRVGSTVYDGSIRTKLENLKEQLING